MTDDFSFEVCAATLQLRCEKRFSRFQIPYRKGIGFDNVMSGEGI